MCAAQGRWGDGLAEWQAGPKYRRKVHPCKDLRQQTCLPLAGGRQVCWQAPPQPAPDACGGFDKAYRRLIPPRPVTCGKPIPTERRSMASPEPPPPPGIRTAKSDAPSAGHKPAPAPRRSWFFRCASFFGLLSLGYFLGAAVIFFDLPTSSFLRRAFVGGVAWYDVKKTA